MTAEYAMAVLTVGWRPVLCSGCGAPFCPEYSDAEALSPMPALYCTPECRKRRKKKRKKQRARERREAESVLQGCTGKVFYLNLEYAQQALERVRQRYPSGGKLPIRAYECPHCGGAHLTSQPASRATSEQEIE